MVSITSCSDDRLIDGAAILQHSIHISSEKSQNYTYEMMAVLHPSAKECALAFETLGYTVLFKNVPFEKSNITSKWLRTHIDKGGCCQDKEFLKLYAYTFVQYPIVVHLDLDIIMLQPLDELFDAMLLESTSRPKLELQFQNESVPTDIQAFFTRDYNLAEPYVKHVGIQGGFFIIRPSLQRFQEYIDIIHTHNFPDDYSAWGGKGYGGFYGARQIQGILSYFYGYIHPNTSVELNRCIYNTMIDEARYTPEEGGLCKDTKTMECENCRKTDLNRIKLAHFTTCQKPWSCLHHSKKKLILCNEIRRKWFEIRLDMEKTWVTNGWIDKLNVDPTSKFFRNIFYGYCSTGGHEYYPVVLPNKNQMKDFVLN